MRLFQTVIAFLSAALVGYALAVGAYSWQVTAPFADLYTTGQRVEALLSNVSGLWVYGAIMTIGFLFAFLVAAGLRRVLRPLAPLAYPLAGAAAMAAILVLVEQQLGGGAGVIGGARTPLGFGLQCLAGAFAGLVFAALRPHRD